MFWERESKEVKGIQPYQGYILSTSFMTADADINHLAEDVFANILHYKLIAGKFQCGAAKFFDVFWLVDI